MIEGQHGHAVALLAAAIAGKMLGAGLPCLVVASPATSLLIGVSMVPRAEIALIVMTYGRHMGDWTVPLRQPRRTAAVGRTAEGLQATVRRAGRLRAQGG